MLVVRAFASGCTALTGVEAISNGVPSFQRPKARNAAMTLTMMGLIAVVLFGGITVLAVALHAQAMPDGNPSVISQLALARGMRPDVISAVTLAVDLDQTRLLRQEWESRGIPVPLTMLEAPYRDPIRPLISYVKVLHGPTRAP